MQHSRPVSAEPAHTAIYCASPGTKRAARNGSAAAWVLAVIAGVLLVVAIPLMTDKTILLLFLAAACGVAGGVAGAMRLLGKRHPDFARRLPAWVGVIVAVIVIALAALIITLMINHTANSQSRLEQVRCNSNLRQVGQAMLIYANENKGSYPPGFAALISNGWDPDLFVCPASNDSSARAATTQQALAEFTKPGHCSYVYLAGNASTLMPANFVLVYEPLEIHGGRGAHFLTRDGEVKWCDEHEAASIIGQLKAGVNPPK
jgi:hypothetical protein